MNYKVKKELMVFINTLVPSLRDNLLSEDLFSNNLANRHRNRHLLYEEDSDKASSKDKLLFLIDSFNWSQSKCKRLYWGDIYYKILAIQNEEELNEFINTNSLVYRTLKL